MRARVMTGFTQRYRSPSSFLVACLLAVAAVSISSAAILVRLSHASALACAFWRLILSSAMLLPWLASEHDGSGKNSLVVTPTMVVAGVSLGLHFALWMDSLFRIPVAVSTAIVVLYPVHSMLFETLRGEKMAPIGVAGMILALLGLLLYFGDSLLVGGLDVLGLVESFLALVLAAVYFYLGRMARQEMSVYSYAAPTYLFGALTVLASSLVVGDNVFSYLRGSWVWFVALAAIPMIGGHTVMNYLLEFRRSSTVTSIAFLEPVLASALACVLLGETPELRHILVMLMMAAGVALVVLGEKKEESHSNSGVLEAV